MSAKPDPHAELGVPPNATAAEVHQAFRRRLREHHPDTRPRHDKMTDSASDLALQRVLAAYQTLRQRAGGHGLEAPTDGQPHGSHRHGLGVPSGSLAAPPFSATAVQWVHTAEARPTLGAVPDRTSHRVPRSEWLIRWLLGD
jgi:hypothetical protein